MQFILPWWDGTQTAAMKAALWLIACVTEQNQQTTYSTFAMAGFATIR
jgi:hypothetical protein